VKLCFHKTFGHLWHRLEQKYRQLIRHSTLNLTLVVFGFCVAILILLALKYCSLFLLLGHCFDHDQELLLFPFFGMLVLSMTSFLCYQIPPIFLDQLDNLFYLHPTLGISIVTASVFGTGSRSPSSCMPST